jgi:hypothetical protein
VNLTSINKGESLRRWSLRLRLRVSGGATLLWLGSGSVAVFVVVGFLTLDFQVLDFLHLADRGSSLTPIEGTLRLSGLNDGVHVTVLALVD